MAVSAVPAQATTVPQLSIFAGVVGSTGHPSSTPSVATATDLDAPERVTTDAAGDVYVGEVRGYNVDKITPQGTLSVVAGVPGVSSTSATVGPTAATSANFDSAAGLAVDPQGDLYISDAVVNQLYKVSSSGTLTNVITSGLNEPVSIARDPSGNIYLADGNAGEVMKYSSSGVLSVFKSGFVHPTGIATDSAGNVYVADEITGQVDEITPSGVSTVIAGNIGGSTPATNFTLHLPSSVAVDSAGDVFISEVGSTCRVDEVTPAGAISVVVGTGTCGAPTAGAATSSNLYDPYGLALDSAGDLYIADTNFASGNVVEKVADIGVPSAPTPATPTAQGAASAGYWLVGSDGGAFSFGPGFYGSTGNLKLNQPVLAVASSPDGKGYWFVARDGGIFSYGDAAYHGSVPGLGVKVTDIVGVAVDSATGGYWVVGADGGVYSFDAPFHGSLPGTATVSDIVGIAATPDGGGYYLVGADGAVYAFGDAKYQGGANTLAHLGAKVVGIAVDGATGGYWEASADGGVFSYNAPFEGSAAALKLAAPVVGIGSSGNGYYLTSSDGGVFSYGTPFEGSMGGKHLNAPITGIAVAG